MLIEFVGSPGVGKTTVAAGIAEALRGTGVRVHTPVSDIDHGLGRAGRFWAKSRNSIAYGLRRPIVSARSAAEILRTRQNAVSDYVGCVGNWLHVCKILSDAQRCDGYTLLDQGLAQALWSVGFAAKAGSQRLPASMAALVAGVRRPDIVIAVCAPVDVICDRLRARSAGGSRLDGDSDPSSSLFRSEALVASICEDFAERGVKVETLQNGADRSCADVIAEGMRLILSHAATIERGGRATDAQAASSGLAVRLQCISGGGHACT